MPSDEMIDLAYEEEYLSREISQLLQEKRKVTQALSDLINKQATLDSLLAEKVKKSNDLRKKMKSLAEAKSRMFETPKKQNKQQQHFRLPKSGSKSCIIGTKIDGLRKPKTILSTSNSSAMAPDPPELTLYDVMRLGDKNKDFDDESLEYPSPKKDEEPLIKFEYSSLKFKVVDVLVKAQMYKLKTNDDSSISFRIKDELFNHLVEYKNNSQQFKYRVFLRMSRFIEQQKVYFDFIPTKVKISVNGKAPVMRGENDENSDFVKIPVDITKQCWDKQDNEAKLEVEEGDEMDVVVGVYFVRVLSVNEAVAFFRDVSIPRKHEIGLKAVYKMLDDSLSEPLTSLLVPLTCPLSKQRIEIPCIGIDCDHVACFDLRSFLEGHKNTLIWNCPICGKLIENVVADGMMTHILNIVSPQCKAIKFDANGAWTEVDDVDVESSVQVSSTESDGNGLLELHMPNLNITDDSVP